MDKVQELPKDSEEREDLDPEQCYPRYKVVSLEQIHNQQLTIDDVWELEHDQYGHPLEEDDPKEDNDPKDAEEREDPKEENPDRPITMEEWWD